MLSSAQEPRSHSIMLIGKCLPRKSVYAKVKHFSTDSITPLLMAEAFV